MVSRDCNHNFHNINHIFLKNEYIFLLLRAKSVTYALFDRSNRFKVLFNINMFQIAPSAVFTTHTIYQNLRQIEWLGPL